MSTKTTQTTQAQYNQPSMDTYNNMQSGLGSAINGYMNNPFGNPFFQQQQQMGAGNARMQNQSMMSNLTNNMTASGMGGSNNPAALSLMQNQMRANSANTANQAFMNPTNNALGLQQNAMGMANSYRPLQTGQTGTQTQSGVGSWLPQILGGGLSLLTGGLLGGGGGGGSTGGSSFMNMGLAGTNAPQMPNSYSPYAGNFSNPVISGPLGGYSQPNNPLLGQMAY